MIEKLARSIRTRGIGGTVTAAVEAAAHRVRHARVRQHLGVPVEMVRNPRHARAWLRDRLAAKDPSSLGLPWIARACLDFMDAYLKPEHCVFEWGGGGSTIYFLKRGCRVTTVESSDVWVRELNGHIARLGPDALARWDLRYVPVAGNDDPAIVDYIAQVDRGAPWDLVMVDGWARTRCLRAGATRVRAGGVLVLDNADQAQFAGIPAELSGWTRHKLRGLGVARTWVTQTDAYVRTPPT